MRNNVIANEQVTFKVNNEEFVGILTIPDSQAPYPVIILLHGSERLNADNPYLAEHAENLVHSGFGVFRYNGLDWENTNAAGIETLENRTEEVIAVVKYLQSRSDINPDAVGLWGISQGGWICQMAAATYDGVAFIIPISGPGVTPAEQEVFRVEAESRAEGFDDDGIAKAVLIRRLMVDIVLNEPKYQTMNQSEAQRLGQGPWSELVALTYSSHPVDLTVEFGTVVEILNAIKDESWVKFLHLEQVLPMFENLPPQAWGMVKAQLRAVMDVNPAQFLTKVHCPVLAIFGEKDTSVPVEKSITLYKKYLGEAGNEAFTYRVFPNANHGIRVGEFFAEGYFEVMLDWLKTLSFK